MILGGSHQSKIIKKIKPIKCKKIKNGKCDEVSLSLIKGLVEEPSHHGSGSLN